MFLWLLLIGGFGAVALAYFAVRGPSPAKTVKRRMELIKERHGDVIAGNAQAQIRKLFAQRAGKLEGYASTLIPKPALLRKRLEMTGKDITLSKYAMICIGIFLLVTVALKFKGAPLILAMLVGLFFGIGGPHFVIGKLILRRVKKFNSNFPDAIELMVRGLRSGLPITETLGIVAGEITGPVGVEFRMVADKMKIGRTMEAALQDTADRLGTPEFQFFVITLAIQRETGGIAIKAALTGHLVMSTLHTNSAPETVTRLLDMGLEPFNVASALNLVLAQRLVRRICTKCQTQYDPEPEEIAAAKVKLTTTMRDLRFTEEALVNAKAKATKKALPYLENLSLDTTIGELGFFKGAGCDDCGGTGLKGRQGVYEVMVMTPRLRKLVMQNVGAAEIRDAAIEEGMLTLRMDAWLKVMKGITTTEQMIRETSP